MNRRALSLLILLVVSAIPFLSPLLRGEVFSFRDHFDYFVPLRHFTATTLRAGELPLWNPFNGSGERWLANPQTGVFYPPFWIFLILPFPAAYVAYLWLHVFILGVGTFLLFSRWASNAASLVGGAAVMLCGPTLSLLDISNNLATLAWIPLVIKAAIRRSTPETRRPLSLDAILITLMFLGGEPFLASVGAAIYAVIVIFRSSERKVGRRLAMLAAVGAAALLLSGVQLLPFLELLQGSDRLIGAASLREPMASSDWLASIVPPTDPLRSGPALEASQRYIFSVYLGLPLVFAAAAAAASAPRLERRRQIVIAFWMSLFLVCLILSAGRGFPAIGWLWAHLGLDVSRYPSRLVSVAAVAVIALATMGLDCLAERSRSWRVVAIAGLVLSVVAALLIFAAPEVRSWRVMVSTFWLVLITLILIARPGVFRRPLFLVPLIVFDFAIAARPLLRSQRFQTSIPVYGEIVQPPLKLARLMGQDGSLRSEEDRLVWLSGYLNLLIRRFDAGSPAPVLSADYLRMHDQALTEPRVDIVDFLSIGFLATTRDIRHPAYQPITRIGPVTLFRNLTASSPAQSWSSYRLAASYEDALEMIGRPASSATIVSNVSCRPGVKCRIPEPDVPSAVRRDESIRFRGLNEVIVDISAPAQSILTLSQLDAPGWKVDIDDTTAEALRANGLFRAVLVPAGNHRVRWSYRPRSLVMGITMSTIALVVMIGEVFYVCRRRGQGVFS